MSVDLIIPVYRPDEKLNKLLTALESQTMKPERIIIVHTGEVLSGEPDYRADVMIDCDGSAEDAFRKMAEVKDECTVGMQMSFGYDGDIPGCESKTVRILCTFPKDKFDHGGSRNLGASLSTADVMVFMTQDAVPADEHLLENLVAALGVSECFGKLSDLETIKGEMNGERACETVGQKDTQVAAAYARQLPYEDCRAVERYIREFNYPAKSELRTKADIPTRGIKTFCLSNVCAAYRRDMFDQLGGFVEQTIFNEDMLFGAKAINAGYGVVYAAEAKVYHSHNLGLSDQFHRNFDNAVSQAEHPEVFAAVSSEKEGMKLVRYCISRMKEDGKLYLVPYFVLNCACRYAGFFLGKRYRKLPMWLVEACSLNKRYWSLKKE